jgi:Holliday junction DNA helicase RuvA
MIAFLNGELVVLYPTFAQVDVGGVGYELQIPLSTYDRLPQPPARVRLLTHLVVREDAHTLYGFATDEERDLFRLLINNVSGVGPRLALAVLSGASVAHFRQCVVANDVVSLSQIKGVGKKTAEKIIFELRDKLGVSEAWRASDKTAVSSQESAINDAVLGLIALGYKQADAVKAVRAVAAAKPGAGAAELIREALKFL